MDFYKDFGSNLLNNYAVSQRNFIENEKSDIGKEQLPAYARDVYLKSKFLNEYAESVYYSADDPREQANARKVGIMIHNMFPEINEDVATSNYKSIMKGATGYDLDAKNIVDIFGSKLSSGYKSQLLGVSQVAYLLGGGGDSPLDKQKREEERKKYLQEATKYRRTDYYTEYDKFLQRAFLDVGDVLPSSSVSFAMNLAGWALGNPVAGATASSLWNGLVEWGNLAVDLAKMGADEETQKAFGAIHGLSASILEFSGDVASSAVFAPIKGILKGAKDIIGTNGTMKIVDTAIGQIAKEKAKSYVKGLIGEPVEEALQDASAMIFTNLSNEYNKKKYGTYLTKDDETFLGYTKEEFINAMKETWRKTLEGQVLFGLGSEAITSFMQMQKKTGKDGMLKYYGELRSILDAYKLSDRTEGSKMQLTNNLYATKDGSFKPKENEKINIKGRTVNGIFYPVQEDQAKANYLKKNNINNAIYVTEVEDKIDGTPVGYGEAGMNATHMYDPSNIKVTKDGKIVVDKKNLDSAVQYFLRENDDFNITGIKQDGDSVFIQYDGKVQEITTQDFEGDVVKDTDFYEDYKKNASAEDIEELENKENLKKAINQIKENYTNNSSKKIVKEVETKIIDDEGEIGKKAIEKVRTELGNIAFTDNSKILKALGLKSSKKLSNARKNAITDSVIVYMDRLSKALGIKFSEYANTNEFIETEIGSDYGFTEVVDGFTKVFLAKDADSTTAIHELAHSFLAKLGFDNFDKIEGFSSAYKDELKADLENLEQDKKEGKAYWRTQEKFAEDFEKFIKSGEIEDSKLKTVFENLKNAITSVLELLQDVLPKEKIDMFNNLLGSNYGATVINVGEYDGNNEMPISKYEKKKKDYNNDSRYIYESIKEGKAHREDYKQYSQDCVDLIAPKIAIDIAKIFLDNTGKDIDIQGYTQTKYTDVLDDSEIDNEVYGNIVIDLSNISTEDIEKSWIDLVSKYAFANIFLPTGEQVNLIFKSPEFIKIATENGHFFNQESRIINIDTFFEAESYFLDFSKEYEQAEIKNYGNLSLLFMHGTPWLFDKWDLSAIGSGEGGQYYGWGFYVTNAIAVAKGYAERNTENKLSSYYKNERTLRIIDELSKIKEFNEFFEKQISFNDINNNTIDDLLHSIAVGIASLKEEEVKALGLSKEKLIIDGYEHLKSRFRGLFEKYTIKNILSENDIFSPDSLIKATTIEELSSNINTASFIKGFKETREFVIKTQKNIKDIIISKDLTGIDKLKDFFGNMSKYFDDKYLDSVKYEIADFLNEYVISYSINSIENLVSYMEKELFFVLKKNNSEFKKKFESENFNELSDIEIEKICSIIGSGILERAYHFEYDVRQFMFDGTLVDDFLIFNLSEFIRNELKKIDNEIKFDLSNIEAQAPKKRVLTGVIPGDESKYLHQDEFVSKEEYEKLKSIFERELGSNFNMDNEIELYLMGFGHSAITQGIGTTPRYRADNKTYTGYDVYFTVANYLRNNSDLDYELQRFVSDIPISNNAKPNDKGKIITSRILFQNGYYGMTLETGYDNNYERNFILFDDSLLTNLYRDTFDNFDDAETSEPISKDIINTTQIYKKKKESPYVEIAKHNKLTQAGIDTLSEEDFKKEMSVIEIVKNEKEVTRLAEEVYNEYLDKKKFTSATLTQKDYNAIGQIFKKKLLKMDLGYTEETLSDPAYLVRRINDYLAIDSKTLFDNEFLAQFRNEFRNENIGAFAERMAKMGLFGDKPSIKAPKTKQFSALELIAHRAMNDMVISKELYDKGYKEIKDNATILRRLDSIYEVGGNKEDISSIGSKLNQQSLAEMETDKIKKMINDSLSDPDVPDELKAEIRNKTLTHNKVSLYIDEVKKDTREISKLNTINALNAVKLKLNAKIKKFEKLSTSSSLDAKLKINLKHIYDCLTEGKGDISEDLINLIAYDPALKKFEGMEDTIDILRNLGIIDSIGEVLRGFNSFTEKELDTVFDALDRDINTARYEKQHIRANKQHQNNMLHASIMNSENIQKDESYAEDSEEIASARKKANEYKAGKDQSATTQEKNKKNKTVKGALYSTLTPTRLFDIVDEKFGTAFKKNLFFGNKNFKGLNKAQDEYIKNKEERIERAKDEILDAYGFKYGKEETKSRAKAFSKILNNLCNGEKFVLEEKVFDITSVPVELQKAMKKKVANPSQGEYTKSQLIGIYIRSLSENGVKHLTGTEMNISPNQIAWVVNEFENGQFQNEKRVADTLMLIIGEKGNTIKDIHYRRTGQLLTLDKYYYPDYTMEKKANLEATLGTDTLKNTISSTFTIEREIDPNTSVNLDVLSTFESDIAKQEFYISHAEMFDRINDVMYGSKEDAGLYDIIASEDKVLADTIMSSLESMVRNTSSLNNEISNITSRFLANAMASKISYNLSSVLQQPASLFLTAQKYSLPKTIASFYEVITNKAVREELWAIAPQVKNRSNMTISMAKEMTKLAKKPMFQAISKFVDIGLIPMEKLDLLVATAMFKTAYDAEVLNTNTSGAESLAAMKATQFVLDTQSSKNAKDTSLIYSKADSLMKVMLMFTNQLNKQYNMLADGIIQKKLSLLMSSLFATTLSSAFVVLVTGRFLTAGTDDDEAWEKWLKAIALENISVIPVAGEKVQRVIEGYAYKQTDDIVTRSTELARTLFRSSDDKNEKTKTAVKNLTSSLFDLTGLPSVASRRFLDSVTAASEGSNIGEAILTFVSSDYKNYLEKK